MLRRDDRIELFVVAKYTHQSSVSDRTHEVLFPAFRLKQINYSSVLKPCSHAEVCMFSGSRNSVDRLRQECHIKPVHAENVSDYMLYLSLVVGCLHRCRILPVDLELLHDVVEVAGIAHFGLNSAYLFMPHLNTEAVIIEYFQSLLKSCGDRSCNPLPVLFLEFLCNRELISVCPVIRSLHPEFKLSSIGQQKLIDLIDAAHSANMLKNIRIILERLMQTLDESVYRLFQVDSGSYHGIAIVAQV